MKFLTTALDRQIAQDAQDRNAEALHGDGKKPAAPGPGGKVKTCKKWLKGECDGKCPNKQHPDNLWNKKGDVQPAAPAPGEKGDKGKGKGKGKDKGKKGKGGKDRASSAGSAGSYGRNLPCKRFQEGQCPRTAEECRYPHRWATAEEKKQLENIGKPRSASPPAPTRACPHWARGNCTWGAECRMLHDPSKKGKDAAPAKADPKAKAKAKAAPQP